MSCLIALLKGRSEKMSGVLCRVWMSVSLLAIYVMTEGTVLLTIAKQRNLENRSGWIISEDFTRYGDKRMFEIIRNLQISKENRASKLLSVKRNKIRKATSPS